MPLPSTMTPIATTTLSSSVSSITFSNIPQGYTDLFLSIQITSSSSNSVFLRYNGDTGTNYSETRLYGSGTAAGTDRNSNQTYCVITNYAWPTTTSGDTNSILQIQNYSNSTTYKTHLSRANKANGGGVDAIVGLWRSTAAITSIGISTNGFAGTTTLSTGTTITLYGIKAAP